MTFKKTKCPITREHFHKHAVPLAVLCNHAGQEFKEVAAVREFKGPSGEVDGKGTLGWFFNNRVKIKIGGEVCVAQMQVMFTLVGSKVTDEEEEE